MKSYLIIFSVFVSAFANAQLNGFEHYQFTEERNFNSEKQYVLSEGAYEYILLDATDKRISKFLFEAVYDEVERIFSENNVKIGEGYVVEDSDWVESDRKSIEDAVADNYEFIMLRYELKDGYFLYINLQDEFCACFVTREIIN